MFSRQLPNLNVKGLNSQCFSIWSGIVIPPLISIYIYPLYKGSFFRVGWPYLFGLGWFFLKNSNKLRILLAWNASIGDPLTSFVLVRATSVASNDDDSEGFRVRWGAISREIRPLKNGVGWVGFPSKNGGFEFFEVEKIVQFFFWGGLPSLKLT